MRSGWGLCVAACVSAWLGCRGETVDSPTVDDAGSVADSADAASVAGPELLDNPGFELGCAGWIPAEATAEESSVARTGSRSCRVCGWSTVDAYFFGQIKTGTFVEGTKYLGEMWLRADPGDAAVAPDPMLRLELIDKDDNQIAANDQGAIGLDSTWKRATTLITITKGTAKVRLEVWSHGGGTCFLVDDASLRVIP